MDHFKEDDRRSRIGKQLCVKDPGPAAAVGGQALSANPAIALAQRGFFSQGCLTTPADAANIFGTINTKRRWAACSGCWAASRPATRSRARCSGGDVYDIESAIDPIYQVRTDIYQLNVEWAISPTMKLYSLTSFTDLDLFTRQDYSRYTPSSNFNAVPNPVNLVTTPAAFGGFGVPAANYNAIYAAFSPAGTSPIHRTHDQPLPDDRISSAFTKQWSSELRLQSNFDGRSISASAVSGSTWKATGNYYVMFNHRHRWYQVTNTLLAGGPNCTNARVASTSTECESGG